MLKVTLREIEQVFVVLEELGLSREAVVIPLKPQHPGRVAMRPDNRLDIVLDSEVPLEEALPGLRQEIAAIMATPAGARLKREQTKD
jgi:hypothetical protein